MLSAIWFKYNFHISAQSGFYIDYLYKRVSEIFVRICFIYMSQFFGEKFMIEIWTKKFFFYTTQYFSNFTNVTKLNYFWFFFHLVVLSLYFMCVLFLLMLYLL